MKRITLLPSRDSTYILKNCPSVQFLYLVDSSTCVHLIRECSGDIAGVIMPNIVVFRSVPNLSSEWSFHNVEFIPIPFGMISDLPLTVTLRLECMCIIILLVLFSPVTCAFTSGVICDIRKKQNTYNHS
jgi:hypothetical protein